MRPPAFRRHHKPAPVQKFIPEIGDVVYVRVNREWVRGKVCGTSIEEMRETSRGVTRVQKQQWIYVQWTELGDSLQVDVSNYPTAWCWPHDMVNLGGKS
jgi:hypothetical protein